LGSTNLGVKQANTVANIIAVDAVATTAATAKAVISKSTMATAGRNAIAYVELQFAGAGDSWLIPNVKNASDALASNASSAQKNVVVTTVGSFAVGDLVLLYENDYTTHEFAKIASITTGTSTLTMVGNLTNTYATADGAHALPIEDWANDNAYIKVKSGYDWTRDRLNWTSLYLRRMSAVNITVDGVCGVV